MANKVITIGKSTTDNTASTEDKLIVYKDINMIAIPSGHVKPDESLYSKYEILFSREFETSEEEYMYLICSEYLTEADKKALSIYYTEYESYDQALAIWKKYAKWKIHRLVNVSAVLNSLRNIFTWIPGERILNPEFGSNLRRLLYEGITDYNVEQIIAEIRHCVSVWEPRVTIDKVINISNEDDTEDNTVHLGIVYTIKGLSEEQYLYEFSYNPKM